MTYELEKQLYRASLYLGNVTLTSLTKLFKRAKEIMDWLGAIAAIVAKQVYDVLQDYHKGNDDHFISEPSHVLGDSAGLACDAALPEGGPADGENSDSECNTGDPRRVPARVGPQATQCLPAQLRALPGRFSYGNLT